MTTVLFIVPPLVRADAAPALGPWQLSDMLRRAGLEVSVLDLGISWLRRFGDPDDFTRTGLVGDHDKAPVLLNAATRAFRAQVPLDQPERLLTGVEGAHRAARGLGPDLASFLVEELDAIESPPGTVGISVSWNSQVLPALFLARELRRRWPGARLLVGGPQITATRLAANAWGVDHAVRGAGEDRLAQLLGLRSAAPRPPEIPARAFSGYSQANRTYPAQLSTGCAYGRCTFCTYPAVEGAYRPRALDTWASAAATGAKASGCTRLAFRDSLLTAPRLRQLAVALDGQGLLWAATTKLSLALDRTLALALARSGLATLELGLESVDPLVQRTIGKRQPLPLLDAVLDAFAGLPTTLVLNLMVGLPGEGEAAAMATLAWCREVLPARHPHTRVVLEEHVFELERLAPLARRIPHRDRWPFSSLLDWDRPDWHDAVHRQLVGAPPRVIGARHAA